MKMYAYQAHFLMDTATGRHFEPSDEGTAGTLNVHVLYENFEVAIRICREWAENTLPKGELIVQGNSVYLNNSPVAFVKTFVIC